jgi:DNA-binding transcriptional regulator LsrR (DeoR family)
MHDFGSVSHRAVLGRAVPKKGFDAFSSTFKTNSGIQYVAMAKRRFRTPDLTKPSPESILSNPLFVLDVARRHFEQGLKVTDIAIDYEISERQVGRALDQARLQGFIKVTRAARIAEREKALLNKFPYLKEALVVSSSGHPELDRQNRAVAAAEYFEQHVRDGMSVGLSGGNSNYELVRALPDRERDIHLYPAGLVGRGPDVLHVDPMVLITQLWIKSGRKPGRARYTTVFPSEPGGKDESPDAAAARICAERADALSRSLVASVLREIESVDILFSSIGPAGRRSGPEPYTYHTSLRLLKDAGVTYEWLDSNGVVGDINYCFYDPNGTTREKFRFFLTLEPKQLAAIADAYPKRKMVLTADMYAVKPLAVALGVGLCSVLVTDSDTAELLLDPQYGYPQTLPRKW